jgi:uncharacterized phage protein gp47/JayE
MPFSRPALTDLRRQTANDINAALPGVDALLRFSNLGIIGEVQAELADGIYGYLDYIALQSNPFTSTGEYLEGWAALKGVTRKAASGAIGTVTFTGTNGKTIPAGSNLTRTDGAAYTTVADVTIAAGTATAQIVATVGGSAGNALAGTTLFLGVGISGVSGTALAATDLAGGAEIEPDYELRGRMLAVYAKPPQGGSISDYGEWALEVPGVTRCWVKPNAMGPGSIVLLFMMDAAEAAHGGFPQGTNGCATYETRDTPATGDQLALANYLFFKQPPTALIYAVSPIPNALGFTIAGIASANAATRSAIQGAIAAALQRDAIPGGVTNVSAVEGAIAAVAGSAGFVITAITASAGAVSPGASGNITSNAGALPVFGSATFA